MIAGDGKVNLSWGKCFGRLSRGALWRINWTGKYWYWSRLQWRRQGQSCAKRWRPNARTIHTHTRARACGQDTVSASFTSSLGHISHCAMGWPMYMSLVCLAALAACPLAATGWPVDSNFYDQIKRVVYGDDNLAIAAAAAVDDDDSSSSFSTDSPPLPPLSLPLTQASRHII